MSTVDKPSRNEDEYFAKLDAELLQAAQKRAQQQAAEAARRTHYMKCPKDGYDLTHSTLHGVEIDLCGHCGGFWLDDGELETLSQAEDKGLLGRVFGDVRAALARTRGKA